MTTSPTYDTTVSTPPTSTNVVRPDWMTDEMYQTWLGFYLDAGGDAVQNAADQATAQFRQDTRYATKWFPGIRAEDGTIRYADRPEETYASNMRAFRNTIEGENMNPDLFMEDYINLITGDVSPNEFASRVNALSERVLQQGPAIRDFYAENYGISMTREGILAGLMSSRVNDAVLDRQITMAEIAGEGISRGFDIGAEFAQLLAAEGGMNRNEAQLLFGTAQSVLPLLTAAARRHGDPTDEFNIYDFAIGASDIMDPTQRARMDRILGQERALYTGGAGVDIATGKTGVTGLADV